MKTSSPVQSVSVERPAVGNLVNLPTVVGVKSRVSVDGHKTLEPMEINALMVAVAEHQDIDAYQLLYKLFVPKVRAYMSKIGSDRAFAEEMAQEALLTVWRKARLFDPGRGQASTWIYTIARNVRIDALRRGPRPTFDPNDPAFIPEDEPAADVAFERQQDAARLRVAMASLKPDEIKTLRLSFFEDMAHPAIAAALGIPIGTVKSRIRNACLKLRAILKDA
jgi:RNA polymerase sigma factor (sigma-70 family)